VKGGCATEFLDLLDLPKETAESIAKFSNLGVAQSTWNTYRTAKTMLLKCSKETGHSMELPLNNKNILIFIDYPATKRGLKSASISSYLSGLRQLHIIQNFDPPAFRTGLVKLVLCGISNQDGITARDKGMTGRLPMTTNVMLLLQKLISKLDYSVTDKAMIWAASTLAFAGAFRINEILCKRESTFDPDFELLSENVNLRTNKHGSITIQVTLKCPSRTFLPQLTFIKITDRFAPYWLYKSGAGSNPETGSYPFSDSKTGPRSRVSN
jgi:hypothetical protein